MSAPKSVHGLVPVSVPRRLVFFAALVTLLAAPAARGQVVTIDTNGNPIGAHSATVDRRFAQIQPTNIQLPKGAMDARAKTALLRNLEGEQGWAMRPFPGGHRGLTLIANGKLDPAGEAYLDMVTTNGLSAKPGDAVAITDIKFDHDKLVLSLNGGPDAKHRFLQHIQIGIDPTMTTPVVPDNPENDPQGAHVTLAFKGRMPPVTDAQVKALLAPLISFDMKTPVQAFTDTLPKPLKDAILSHHVMVGMTTDMVMFALGQPNQKVREMDGQMPFEEWIYGMPPDPVQFVRINGNRVIRVEIAKVGEPIQIFTKDEVDPLMRASAAPRSHRCPTPAPSPMGDTHPNPNMQAPNAPPSFATRRDPPPGRPQKRRGARCYAPGRVPAAEARRLPRRNQSSAHTSARRLHQARRWARNKGTARSQPRASSPSQSQQDKSTPPKPADGQPAPAPSQQQPSPQ